jgi:hypothetical protein
MKGPLPCVLKDLGSFFAYLVLFCHYRFKYAVISQGLNLYSLTINGCAFVCVCVCVCAFLPLNIYVSSLANSKFHSFAHYFLFVFFLFLWYWGLNSGPTP